jgi:hypothetical protein
MNQAFVFMSETTSGNLGGNLSARRTTFGPFAKLVGERKHGDACCGDEPAGKIEGRHAEDVAEHRDVGEHQKERDLRRDSDPKKAVCPVLGFRALGEEVADLGSDDGGERGRCSEGIQGTLAGQVQPLAREAVPPLLEVEGAHDRQRLRDAEPEIRADE